MRGKRSLILGTALAALLALAACGDGEEQPKATPSPATAATATRAATAAATIATTQPSGRTGVAELDPVIDALLSKDAKTIRPLIVFTSVPCTTAVGMGGPPKCPQGQTDGHLVDVFYSGVCEGEYKTPGAEEGIAQGLAQSTLYAVYRVPADFRYAELGFLAEYVAIISRPAIKATEPATRNIEDAATLVLINHGRITGTVFSCALPPAQYVEQLGLTDAVLPPAAQ